MNPMSGRLFLATGGAGFVGSHAVQALLDEGARVVVVDDLSAGHRAAVPRGAAFVQADAGDPAALDAVLAGRDWDGALHFAARTRVDESMARPLDYLLANAAGTMRLLDACVRHRVPSFVLSSTAAALDPGGGGALDEAAARAPVSAYGESKAMAERALEWAAHAHGLRTACLRYFNAAGADPALRLGEDHRPETHLIPAAIDAALGRRPPLELRGEDYPTPDGTCVRDYVHVSDLAAAHLLALRRMDSGPVVWNLGNGAGHSVRAVLDAVEDAVGRPVPRIAAPRRAGDPAALVARSARARAAGWRPRHAELRAIVETAARWRARNPGGYGG
jgi:UDP-glucose 4-epimerase